MMRHWLENIPKKTRIISWTIVALVAMAFIGYFFSPFSTATVPQGFIDGRDAAAVHAQDVVSLLKETGNNLRKIQELEQQGKYKDALQIVYYEIEKNRTVTEKALALTGDLEKMAKAVPDIEPSRARETALVAISSEVMLVTTLNGYINNDLSRLLQLLGDRLLGRSGDIEALNRMVDAMNVKTDSINNLNNQFTQLMEEFNSKYQ
ncbi:MAG: hypothetical protein KBC26_02535 [Candidatus Pacebacteria bacterium]|nr:hypothetical protein [Candidatus Paceibacterota bacterium]